MGSVLMIVFWVYIKQGRDFENFSRNSHFRTSHFRFVFVFSWYIRPSTAKGDWGVRES